MKSLIFLSKPVRRSPRFGQLREASGKEVLLFDRHNQKHHQRRQRVPEPHAKTTARPAQDQPPVQPVLEDHRSHSSHGRLHRV